MNSNSKNPEPYYELEYERCTSNAQTVKFTAGLQAKAMDEAVKEGEKICREKQDYIKKCKEPSSFSHIIRARVKKVLEEIELEIEDRY